MREYGNRILCRVGALVLSVMMLMCGCASGPQEEISDNMGQLLQDVSSQFIGVGGYEKERNFVVMDISAFDESLKQEYNEWVQTNYANEDTVIVVLGPNDVGFEEEDDVANHLRENGYADADAVYEKYDWTTLIISPKEVKKKIRDKRVICVDIEYNSIEECEGLEVTLQYKDEVWTIEEIEETYRS